MSNENETIANQAVEAFKALLDEKAIDVVGEKNFITLNKIICEALSEHSEIILERFNGVIKQLRSEIERPSLEL